MLTGSGQDIRYGLRRLRKEPGFTVVATLTLALGIGITVLTFSVLHTQVRELPYDGADRIMQVWESSRGRRGSISPLNLRDWQQQSQTFEALAGYSYEAPALTGKGEAERIRAMSVSASFFSVFSLRPIVGRDFLPEEERRGEHRVVILSEGVWKSRYGADPHIAGTKLELNGEPYTIVGVMPEVTLYLGASHYWMPLALDLERIERGAHFLFAIGRLKEGVTQQQGQAEMDTIAARLAQQYPETNSTSGITMLPLGEQIAGRLKLPLWVMFAAGCMLLLIACANVAGLLVARAAARRREMAVRAALGAGSGRLMRHLLVESVLVSLAGGALGTLLASFLVDTLATAPMRLPRATELSLDGTALLFALGVSLFTGLVFGLAPALHVTRSGLMDWLKEATPTAGRARQRLRSGLVVAEVAASLVLLVGAGLLAHSFFRLQAVPAGFESEGVLTMKVALPKERYPQAQRRLAFTDGVLQRVSAIPGVIEAAVVDSLPFSGSRASSTFDIPGYAPAEGEELAADSRLITPGYFRTMGMALVKGRSFGEQDHGKAPPVLIVNQAFEQRFFPEGAVGRSIMLQGVEREIVGVVGDIRHDDLTSPPYTEMYTPFAQAPSERVMLAMRTQGDLAQITAAARRAVLEVDPYQPVFDVQTMQARLARAVALPRLSAQLLGVFALLAMLLAAVGLYGVISYSVTQRTREIGIRMALGAERSRILRSVLGQGLTLTAVGIMAGVALAVPALTLIRSLLFGVDAANPLPFAAVALLLALVALLAGYLPARRATRVDPMVALRNE